MIPRLVGCPFPFPLPSRPSQPLGNETNLGGQAPISPAKLGWGEGRLSGSAPSPQSSPTPSVSGRLPHSQTCSSPLAVWVQAPLTPSSDFPTKASAPTSMVPSETCPAQPHLVWASLAGRPGGCRRGRVLWFLCPCPCRRPGPNASACVCSPAEPRSTRYLTRQHCQLFPSNATPLRVLPPTARHLGKLSRPLMRSHMLMSDVSGIPSFLHPPTLLCGFPLGAHTLQVWVRQNKVRGQKERGVRRSGARDWWVRGLSAAGGRDTRSRPSFSRSQDYESFVPVSPAPSPVSNPKWVLCGSMEGLETETKRNGRERGTVTMPPSFPNILSFPTPLLLSQAPQKYLFPSLAPRQTGALFGQLPFVTKFWWCKPLWFLPLPARPTSPVLIRAGKRERLILWKFPTQRWWWRVPAPPLQSLCGSV